MLALQFVSVAVGWDLYERTGDPWMLGLVGLVQIVPALALTLPAGALVDRYRRRDVALISYGALSLATFSLAAVAWLGAHGLAHLRYAGGVRRGAAVRDSISQCHST